MSENVVIALFLVTQALLWCAGFLVGWKCCQKAYERIERMK